MNGEVAMVAMLSENVTLSALLGGSGVGVAKVFIDDVPQKTELPYIVCSVYDTEPFDTKSGASVKDHDTVKVFCYSTTQREVIQIGQLARDAVDELSGTFNGYTVENTRYLRTDGYNIDLVNRKVYVREQDYQVRIFV